MPRIARRITQFTQDDIKRLFQTARTVYRQAGLAIKRAPRKGDIARVLIITPKKMGKAPLRNKIRRQIKALFYEEQLYSSPYDLIIFCAKESTSLSFQQLKEIILNSSLGPNQ